MIKRPRGAIMLYALLCMPAISFLTQKLVQGVIVYYGYDRLEIDRHKARMLALGGIHVAMAQVAPPIPSGEEKGKKLSSQERKERWAKELLERILPTLNQWQTFELTEKVDGMDATLRLALSCENGKINLNYAFDFSKGKFYPEYQKVLSNIKMKDKKKNIDLSKGEFLKRLTTYFKNRGRKLLSLSDLYEIEGFDGLALFFDPGRDLTVKDQKPTVYALGDLFTILTEGKEVPVEKEKKTDEDAGGKEDEESEPEEDADEKDKKDNGKTDKKKEDTTPKMVEKSLLQPWLLSSAMRRLFGLRPLEVNDAKRNKSAYEKAIKQFKLKLGSDFEKLSEVLSGLYGEKGEGKLPDKKFFSQEFDPTVYSMISSCKVGVSEARLEAILEIDQEALNARFSASEKDSDKDEKDGDKNKKQKPKPLVHLRAIYWL